MKEPSASFCYDLLLKQRGNYVQDFVQRFGPLKDEEHTCGHLFQLAVDGEDAMAKVLLQFFLVQTWNALYSHRHIFGDQSWERYQEIERVRLWM